MADLIPDHITADILLRLPSDSLARSKCVSKSWRDLIHSYCCFIQPDSNPGSKIVTLVGSKIYAFDSVLEEDCRAISRLMPIEASSYGLYMAGSCNGIVCVLSCSTNHFRLWNPCTGTILDSTDLSSPPYEFTLEYSYGIQIDTAFGYDHINDDYKVVKWYLRDYFCDDGIGEHLYELCVYSLKENSWRIIREAGNLDLDAREDYLPGEYGFCSTNGAMHWVVEKNSQCYEQNLILTFDLGTYEFRQIPCAPIPQGVDYLRMSLSNLNGCLCLAYAYTYPEEGPGRSQGPFSVDIWVMKEYGVESSWTKLACIIPSERLTDTLRRFWTCKAVTYSEKSGKLLLQLGEGDPVMYDFDTKSLKAVKVKPKEEEEEDVPLKWCTSYVCVYSSASPSLL